MSAETKATARPWRFRMMGSDGGRIFPDYGDIRERTKFIAMVNGRDFHTDQANGQYIVRSVNSHKALVEACRAALKALCSPYSQDCDDVIEKLEEALALAGEKA